GMSNTTQVSQAFAKQLSKVKGKNPKLVFVDGAQGGMTAALIQNPDGGKGSTYWDVVDQRLKKADVTRAEVQAAWINEADATAKQPDGYVALSLDPPRGGVKSP